MSERDQVRLLINDKVVPFRFSDAEVDAILALYAGNSSYYRVMMTAAMLCDTSAVIDSAQAGAGLTVTVEGEGTVKRDSQTMDQGWGARAKAYRELAQKEPVFSVIEMDYGEFSYYELIANSILRSQV